MKSLRMMLLGVPLMISGCSTLSSVQWSSALPWNWFGSSITVTNQGVGGLNATTPMREPAINQGLNGQYTLRSGMKTEQGKVVPYFEALKDRQVMLVINGQNGTVSQIDVLDPEIKTDKGVKIGTPFTDLYDKAFGSCERTAVADPSGVICKVPGSSHISLVFSGEWSGPETLIPPDETLKKWTVSKIVWQQ